MQDHTVLLTSAPQARATFDRLLVLLQAGLDAGVHYTLTLAAERRTGEQNAKLHAMLADIARQVEWAGRLRDVETWKRLLTAAWLRARGESVELLPALDGHGVDVVFRHTAKLTKAECSELLEYIAAWAEQQRVRLTAPAQATEAAERQEQN